MNTVIVISQNLKLDSLKNLKPDIRDDSDVIIVSTHLLFQNEREDLSRLWPNCRFLCFSDFLSDHDMEEIDHSAYEATSDQSVGRYYAEIKSRKNRLVIDRVIERFNPECRILACDDLGIDKDEWTSSGFIHHLLDYYYMPSDEQGSKPDSRLRTLKELLNKPIYSCRTSGSKIVFLGEMHRISYRIDHTFKRDKGENRWFIVNKFLNKFFGKTIHGKGVEYITTLHESSKWQFPGAPTFKVGYIQDGYLPPNYSSYYLKYLNPNGYYYAWDTLGMQVFRNQGIPVKLMSYRKKLYMPEPEFKTVRTVLCVASGSGDWTAMKNRSDEDKMIEAFVELAKRHPDIKFVYRCHPTWVHPAHQGVNSIKRVAEYFNWLNLPNLFLSGHIPSTDLSDFRLSFSRSSLDEDLKNADIVFGEHSVSMIDAAFKRIPFASVNMTGRRDFFCGMTKFGFPHCESIEELEQLLIDIHRDDFKKSYRKAVLLYNEMTDEEN